MSADALITRDGPVNAPLNYQVPNAAEAQPLVVSADFADPTNAGPYVPAVEVVTPNGVVIGPFILQQSIAAGASARVTWFRGVAGSAQGVTPLPGQILQAFAGNATVADFSTNSTVFVDTGFPTNSTLNKISATSALLIVLLGDMTAGGAPDVLFLGTFIDGVNYATSGVHVSSGGNFITAAAPSHVGLGGSTSPPLAAGAHTVKVRCASLAGNMFTVRTSTSVALSILEYEP